MILLLGCLLIATLLPYLAKIPLAIAMQKAGGYDNHYPREQAASLKGFGARAYGAHQNSYEALLVFAIGVFSVIVTHHVDKPAEVLAIVFIVSRLIYHTVYLLNYATARTLTWAVGYFAALAMLVISMCS